LLQRESLWPIALFRGDAANSVAFGAKRTFSNAKHEETFRTDTGDWPPVTGPANPAGTPVRPVLSG